MELQKIPADVWSAAVDALNRMPRSPTKVNMINVIAHAIMAERDRCTEIAERDTRSDLARECGHTPDWLAHGKRIGRAIRKGGQ